MSITHFKTIAEATDLPLIAFQYPGEMAYRMETMHLLIDEVPTLTAMKDWNMGQLHEAHVKELQSKTRPFNVLSTNSAWLMSSLTMGANGLLSGSGSVIADLQVALFDAILNMTVTAGGRVAFRQTGIGIGLVAVVTGLITFSAID